MPKPLQLALSATDVQELKRVRDRDPEPHMREKAAALLKIADGQSGRTVALHGLFKHRRPETVYEWVRPTNRRHRRIAGQTRSGPQTGFFPLSIRRLSRPKPLCCMCCIVTRISSGMPRTAGPWPVSCSPAVGCMSAHSAASVGSCSGSKSVTSTAATTSTAPMTTMRRSWR